MPAWEGLLPPVISRALVPELASPSPYLLVSIRFLGPHKVSPKPMAKARAFESSKCQAEAWVRTVGNTETLANHTTHSDSVRWVQVPTKIEYSGSDSQKHAYLELSKTVESGCSWEAWSEGKSLKHANDIHFQIQLDFVKILLSFLKKAILGVL